ERVVDMELLKTFPNLGKGHDVAYDYINEVKSDKAKKGVKLPQKFNKTAHITFGYVTANYEDVTIEVYKISGQLFRTSRVPFSEDSTLYEIKAEDGNYYTISKKQVLDYEITDK